MVSLSSGLVCVYCGTDVPVMLMEKSVVLSSEFALTLMCIILFLSLLRLTRAR